MKSSCFFKGLTLIIVIIGALNWGLVGLFDWSLVEAIFGYMSMVTRVIYVIVALCGIFQLYLFFTYLGCKKEGSCK